MHGNSKAVRYLLTSEWKTIRIIHDEKDASKWHIKIIKNRLNENLLVNIHFVVWSPQSSYSACSDFSHFFRAAWKPARTRDEKCVCLSVRPSVRQTRRLWQNGRKISPNFYIIRKIIYFPEKKNGWRGQPLLHEILGQQAPVEAKSPILNRYWLVAPQP